MNILKIDTELPDFNKVIKETKKHWHNYSELKKEHTEYIAWLAKAQKIKRCYKKRPIIKITYFCKNKLKDPDNISAFSRKVILDGLVMSKVLKDDRWDYVGGFIETFEIDRKNPRIEVEILSKLRSKR